MFLLFCCLSGCASIVSKAHWPVTVQTNPTGATCVISKGSGVPMHTGNTPMTITLDASRGFFLPAKYNIKCSKEGFLSASSEFSAGLNPWYICNLFVGGLVGWIIVDPATGAMWKLDEIQILNLAESKEAIVKEYQQNATATKSADGISPRYKNITGIVLDNGDIIEGKIINMDSDVVIIRRQDGKVEKYSFTKDVKSFIQP